VPEAEAIPQSISAVAAPKARLLTSELALSQIHYRNFDYLRLFLAVEVVALHLWAALTRGGELWVPIPPVVTFVGLSGFLIPQSLERSRNLWHFGWKRVLRTMPALLVLLLVIAMVFGLKPAIGAFEQYLTAGYHGQFLNVTLPLWSLIVEDVLYACMALLFVFGAHRKLWVTLPILACLIVGRCYATDVMTDYRLLRTSAAFFAGNLVYIFHDRVRRLPWWLAATAVVASLAGWLDFIGKANSPFSVAAVIVLALTLPQIRWRIPDLSYGIYIWHGPVLLYLAVNVAMAPAMPFVVATSVITIAAALLSWYVVEKHALRLKNVWFGASRANQSVEPDTVSRLTASQRAA
jgi:peptidoglycan/LPS O-acetylase OafA/YrhL